MKDNLFNRKLMIYFTAGVDEEEKVINKSKTSIIFVSLVKNYNSLHLSLSIVPCPIILIKKALIIKMRAFLFS